MVHHFMHKGNYVIFMYWTPYQFIRPLYPLHPHARFETRSLYPHRRH